MRLPPGERQELVKNGLLDRRPVLCEGCGGLIEPGEPVLCNDGYERIYGEFVLGDVDDLHEDNWPREHARCAGVGHAGKAQADADGAEGPESPVVRGASLAGIEAALRQSVREPARDGDGDRDSDDEIDEDAAAAMLPPGVKLPFRPLGRR